MVEEARFTPAPHNRRAYLRGGILLLIGVLIYALAELLPAYGGAVQLVALVFAVAGVFTVTKYVLVQHSYLLVRTEEGERYFLVEQTQGRRKSTLCQLKLSEIVTVYDYADREKANAYGGRMFSYTASLGDCVYQTVVARTALGRVAVRIEADGEFLSALCHALEEERLRADKEGQ
jgi:hypothetical protein